MLHHVTIAYGNVYAFFDQGDETLQAPNAWLSDHRISQEGLIPEVMLFGDLREGRMTHEEIAKALRLFYAKPCLDEKTGRTSRPLSVVRNDGSEEVAKVRKAQLAAQKQAMQMLHKTLVGPLYAIIDGDGYIVSRRPSIAALKNNKPLICVTPIYNSEHFCMGEAAIEVQAHFERVLPFYKAAKYKATFTAARLGEIIKRSLADKGASQPLSCWIIGRDRDEKKTNYGHLKL